MTILLLKINYQMLKLDLLGIKISWSYVEGYFDCIERCIV